MFDQMIVVQSRYVARTWNCNKILVPRKCAHALNEILNHCLKSAVGRSCAFGKSSKSESKQKYNQTK